jgi:hypothetical protein
MAEEVLDANTEITPAESSPVENAQPTAEVEKTEGAVEEVKTEESKPAEEPWHKDPRFKKFLDEKKVIEERLQAFEGIESDPDFAAFLAVKRQKEAIAAQQKEPKVDFSRMTADEYADYVKGEAVKSARMEYQNLVETNKKGDEVSREALSFAESVGVDKATFQKEYGPKILQYYEGIAKKIGQDRIEAFVNAVPPKEVFKNFFFDKAGEIGVKKYKEEVDKARKSSFDTGAAPKDEALPADSKSRFDALWGKAFGSSTELPLNAFGKQKG